jgi:hypothetical protein
MYRQSLFRYLLCECVCVCLCVSVCLCLCASVSVCRACMRVYALACIPCWQKRSSDEKLVYDIPVSLCVCVRTLACTYTRTCACKSMYVRVHMISPRMECFTNPRMECSTIADCQRVLTIHPRALSLRAHTRVPLRPHSANRPHDR